MATSDFGNQILVTDANGVTYDLNKDYTAAINAAKASGQDTSQLEAERNAKINSSAYGGQYQTGANVSSSLGTSYDENNVIVNRTDVHDPITTYNPNAKQQTPQTPTVNTAPAYDVSALGDYLDKWLSAAKEQQTSAIDYATDQSVAELKRAEQDAATTYQEQRNQIAIDEAKAKDNQALYAEARGDKGGIGAAQYDSIMNTAAQNRLQVNQAQTKLATDTARQISDLRAQGAYEKADALLQLSQQYLSQLISLEQWAAEYNLSVAQFNASLQQWAAEYDASVADLTGYFKGSPTIQYQQYQQTTLAEQGQTLLSAGIMPSTEQLSAMGWTSAQAQEYLTALRVAAATKSSGSGSSGSGSGSGSSASGEGAYALFLAAYESGDDPTTYIKNHYKSYGLTSQPNASSYTAWANSLPEQLSGDQFQSWMDKLNISLSESSLESVDSMTARYWPVLTQAQRQQVQNLYAHYGYTYQYGT